MEDGYVVLVRELEQCPYCLEVKIARVRSSVEKAEERVQESCRLGDFDFTLNGVRLLWNGEDILEDGRDGHEERLFDGESVTFPADEDEVRLGRLEELDVGERHGRQG